MTSEEKIADLKANFDYVLEGKDLEIKQLGERCNQLLKDKGYLTDELSKLKETLAQTTENDEVAYETLKLHDQEEIGMLNSRVAELEYENAKLKERYNRADVIGYDALKNLTEAKERIRTLLFHLTNDTFYVTFETREQSVEKARQFLRRGIK